MMPFRNILKLSTGDLIAKGAYFLAFVYMAQVLGVANYGVLEFAFAIRTYLLLAADAGLELWAVREAAKGTDVHRLIAIVTPLRLGLAVLAFFSVTGILAVIPENPNLRVVLPLLASTVFLQAFNLKWMFMGHEKMGRVAVGLVASQITFAGCVFLLVRRPADLFWVPVAILASELLMVVYFCRLFFQVHGRPRILISVEGCRAALRPALTLGTAHGLALMNYNLGSILVGVMLGPGPVGWYAAAYKPVTAGLSIPVAYFLGLFPSLSRNFTAHPRKFRSILQRSLRLTAIFALPLGVSSALLADPLIHLLFGPTYSRSVPALQLLGWSAVLVTLRGNFRAGLNAAGQQRLDLLCAGAAVLVNLALNLVLIPKYSIYGAACSTVISELLWFTLSSYLFSRRVMPLKLLDILWRPAVAAVAMGLSLALTGSWWLAFRMAASGLLYFCVLAALKDPEVMNRLPVRKKDTAAPHVAEHVHSAKAGAQ